MTTIHFVVLLPPAIVAGDVRHHAVVRAETIRRTQQYLGIPLVQYSVIEADPTSDLEKLIRGINLPILIGFTNLQMISEARALMRTGENHLFLTVQIDEDDEYRVTELEL